MPARVALTLFCVWMACASIEGCGPAGPPRATVFGKVSLDGASIDKGQIVFIPTGSTTGPSAGAKIEKGEYRTLDGKGPLPGTYRVEITAYRPGQAVAVQGAGGATNGPSGGGSVETIEQYIPEKYNKKSEWTLEVKAGPNPKDFECTTK